MFMLSFRLSRARVLAGVVTLAIIITGALVGVRIASGASVETAAGTSETGKAKKAKKAPAKTNEQRLEFARSFGWEIQEEPAEVLEVIIPKEFDNVYEEYNSMQKQQGYDLSKYAGKRCKRYSYVVANHPDAQGAEVRLNLLVCDNKVIGGDVCSLAPEGFMHGFAM